MKKIFRKLGKTGIALTLLVVSVFGTFAMNSIVSDAKPNDTITLPGGESSFGEYREYEVGKDSNIKNNLAQGEDFASTLINPKGYYYQYEGRDTTALQTSLTNMIVGENSKYYGTFYTAHVHPEMGGIMEFSNNFENAQLGETGINFNVTPLEEKSGILSTLRGVGGETIEYNTENLNERISSKKISGAVPTPIRNQYIPTRSSNVGFFGTVNDELVYESEQSFVDFVNLVFVDNNQNVTRNIHIPYISEHIIADKTVRLDVTDFLLLGKDRGIILVDSFLRTKPNESPVTPQQKKIMFIDFSNVKNPGDRLNKSVDIVDNTDSFETAIIGVTANGDGIIFDGEKQEIVVVGKEDGSILLRKDYSEEKAIFSNIEHYQDENNSNIKYVSSGTGTGVGQFSGYLSGTGIFTAFLDENFDIVNMSNYNGVSGHKVLKSILIQDEKKILMLGDAQAGWEDNGIFSKFLGDNEKKSNNNIATFYGQMEITRDASPKLPLVTTMNIKLERESGREEIDEIMLMPVLKEMKLGTNNIENNRLDDYTSNEQLFKRINKNILNPNYGQESIDWELFGLTKEKDQKTGKDVYSAGPNHEVTYFVTDMSMNETVTSGLVNIIDEDTDIDNPDIDEAKYALKAQNYRVPKGTSNVLNREDVLSRSHAKAWELTEGKEETTNKTKVTTDFSNLNPNKIGVYPVEITYATGETPIAKTIYVTVYDDSMVSGPEDEENTNPDNLKNTELLSALDVTLSLHDARNKYNSNALSMTSAQGWYAYPEDHNDLISIDPVHLTKLTKIENENGEPVDENITINAGRFDASIGVFKANINTRRDGSGASKEVIITIKDDNQPILSSTPFIEIPLGANIPTYVDVMNQVTLSGDDSLDEDDIVVSSLSGTITAGESLTSNDINTGVPGVYPITYYVENIAGRWDKTVTNYVVGEKVLDNKYVIFANNFDIKLADVADSNEGTLKAQVKTKSGYRGQKLANDLGEGIEPINAPVNVEELGSYGKTIGGHKIVLAINEKPTVTKDVFANVYDTGDITKDYIIEGVTKTIDLADAKRELADGKSIISDSFNDVRAWKKNTDEFIRLDEGTHYTTPNNFTASSIVPDTYTYTVTVGDATQLVSRNFSVEVIRDGDPSLTVTPKVVEIPFGSNMSSVIKLEEGVVATDGAKNVAAPQITAKLAFVNGEQKDTVATDLSAIKTNENGVYKYTYHITDSQGISAENERYYIVGENPTIDEDNKVVLFANNYYINDTDVVYNNKGDAAQGNAEAELRNLETGALINKRIRLKENPKEYSLAAGYVNSAKRDKHKVGGFPLTFDVEYATGKTIEKEIIANVVNDDVDYVKGKDAIYQVNKELRRSEVKNRSATTITELKVWNTLTGNDLLPMTDYSVEDTNDFNIDKNTPEILSYKQNHYRINVKTLDSEQESSKLIQIVPGGAPSIVVGPRVTNDIVTLTVEESKHFLASDAVDIVKAWDNEDTDGENGEYDRIRIEVESSNFENGKIGTYLVTYKVTDNDFNTTRKTLAYVVGGRNTTKNAAIFANDFDVEKQILNDETNIEGFVKNKSGLSASEIKRNAQDQIIEVKPIELANITFENLDDLKSTSNVGPYRAKFETKDVSTTIIVSVVDETVAKGEKIYISARNATRRPSEITVTSTASNLTQVKAWEKDSGHILSPVELIETTDYDVDKVKKPTSEINYPVTYTTALDVTAEKSVTITIHPGESPKVFVDIPKVAIDLNETVANVLDGVTMSDNEDGNGLPIIPTPKTVSTNTKDVVIVDYKTVDNDGNSGTNKRSYIVGGNDVDPENDDVAIFANSFSIKKSEFDFNAADDAMNKEILKLAGPAFAKEIATGTPVNVEVNDAVNFKTGAVGPHEIKLKAGSKEIIIIGSIYDKGDVVEGYVIEANDATIRQGDVPTPVEENVTSYGILDAQTPGGIRAWEIETGQPTNVSATAEVPTFAAQAENDPYIITLTTEGKSIERDLFVTTVAGPIIYNDREVVNLKVGDTAPDINEIMNGIRVEHQDADALLAILKAEKQTELTANPIKTDKEGVYVVSYQVTDKENDSSKVVKRTYIIGDGVHTKDSVIFANNFTIDVKDVVGVDDAGNQDPNLEQELVGKTGALAYSREANVEGKGIDEAKPIGVKLTSTTYKKVVGGYPVNLKADAPLGAAKQVTASVLDDEGTGEVDDTHGVQAYSKTYRPSVANGKRLTDLVDASAWKLDGALPVNPTVTAMTTKPDGEVVTLTEDEWAADWPHYHGKGNVTAYKVTVKAGENTQVVDLVIDPEEAPTLSFSDNAEVQEVDLGAENIDLREFLEVSDDHDTLLPSDVAITQNIDYLDTSQKGVQVIDYAVMDSDQNVTRTSRSFIVRDPREDGVGKKFAVFATNYVEHISNYDNSDSAVVRDAKVFVQEVETGTRIAENQLLNSITVDASKFKNKVGPHPLEFTVKADTKAKAKAIASLVEDDINIPDDKEIVLRGAHYNNLAQKAKDKDIVDDITTASAWHRVTGVPVEDVTYIFNGVGYDIADPVPGNYSVKLSAPGAKDVDRNIVLRAGGKPTLTFENDSEIVAVPVLGTQIDVYQDVLGKDDEDTPNDDDKYDNGVANTPLANREKALVYATGSVDTNTQGVYKVTYDVTDLDHNKADTITRIYVVGDATYNEKYALFASDFQEKVDTMQDSDAYLQSKTGAYGIRFSDLETVDAELAYKGAESYKLEAKKSNVEDRIAGAHKIKYVIPEDTTSPRITKTVVANTTKHIDPINPRPKYYIDAKNREIHVSKVGNQTPEELTDMQAWESATGNKPAVEMESDPTFEAKVGTYKITYKIVIDNVVEETREVTIKVIAGKDPLLTVDPDVIQIKKGTDKQTINFYDRVEASDEEDTPGVDEFYPNGAVNEEDKVKGFVYADEKVNTDVSGTYIVDYEVTDLDGNKVTAHRSYVVDGDVQGDYALFADNFAIKIKDVDMDDLEGQLFEKTNARSHQVRKPTIAGETLLDSDGGYTNEAGPYDVTFSVKEQPGLTRTIVASVHDGNEGSKDIMHAINGTIRPSQITQDTVEKLTESKAWDKNTKATVNYTYEVFDKDNNKVIFESPQPIGEYKVIFTTEHDTVLERTITVVAGELPVIEVADHVDRDVVQMTITESKDFVAEDLVDIKKAWDEEDTGSDGEYLDARVGVKHSNFEHGKAGTYLVTYTVTDNDGNETLKTIAYQVGSKDASTNAAIFAHHFDVNKETELSVSSDIEELVKEKSEVYAETITRDNDGKITGIAQVDKTQITFDNLDELTQTSEVGPYDVKFDTADVSTTVVASVIDEHVVTGDKVYISAKNATRRPGQINALSTASKLTQVKAWDKVTGDLVTTPNLVETTDYAIDKITKPMVETTYDVTYTTPIDTTVEKKVTITITPGEKPIVTVDKKVTNVNVGDTIADTLVGVSVTDLEDDEDQVAVKLTPSTKTVDTSQKGLKVVTYTAVDSDGNTGTNTRSYVIGSTDPADGDEVAIFANSFSVKKKDFDFTASDTDMNDAIIALAGPAFAKEIESGNDVTLTVDNANSFKTGNIGPHPITLKAGDKVVTIIGSIYDKGVEKDGQIIEVANATIRQGDVPTPVVANETSYDILDDQTVGGIKAWNVLDGTFTQVSVERETPTFAAQASDDPYKVLLKTLEGTEVTRSITVTTVAGPIIYNDRELVELDVNAQEPTIVDIMNDIRINHTDDVELMTILTNEKAVELTNNPIKTDKPGVFVVAYQVTDKENDKSNIVYRTYVIGKAVIEDDSVIFADNFKIEEKDVKKVDEDGNQEPGLEKELVKHTEARGFARRPKDNATGIDVAKPLDVKLVETTYKKAAGAYPIKLKVEGGDAKTQVIASVVNNIDGKGDVDDTYGVQAFHKTIRPSLAEGVSLETLVSAMAWKVEDGSKVSPTITATNTHTGDTYTDLEWQQIWPHTEGQGNTTTYDVAVRMGTNTQTVQLVIDPEEAPRITFEDNKFVQEVDLGGVAVDTKAIVEVEDDHDTLTKADVNVDITQIDTSKKGVIVVTYTATDSDRNTGTVERSYIVRDENEDGVGDTHVIFATNFVRHVKDVDTTDRTVATDAKVFIQAISDGIKVPDIDLMNHLTIDQGGYGPVVGPYEMKFTTDLDHKAKAGIIASVVQDDIVVPETDEIILIGDNYSGLAQSAKDKDIVTELTNARAWHRVTGEEVDSQAITATFVGTGYDKGNPTPGDYVVSLSTLGATSVERDIELTEGNPPKLEFLNDSRIIQLPVDSAAVIDVYEDVEGTDEEDLPTPGDTYPNGALNTPEDERLPAYVYATGAVNPGQEGVYAVTYDVTDLDHNKAQTITRYYVVGDAVVNNKYALFATGFQEKVEDMTTADEDIIGKAGSYAVRFTDLAIIDVDVAYKGAETYKAEAAKVNAEDRVAGPHKINFVVGEDATDPKLQKEIIANTTKHIPPVEPMPAYYIDAKDRTIHVSRVGNQTPQELTELRAWNTKTGEMVTPDMVDTPAFEAKVGTYDITYNIAPSGTIDATKAVVIDVIEGAHPVLEVKPEVIKVNRNADASKINFYDGVKATDEEDTPNNGVYPNGEVNEPNKVSGKVYADGTIDTSVPGTYIYHYEVTDADGNKATGQRSYIVDGDHGDAYALYADNFAINIADVAEEADRKDQLFEKTNARSHQYADPTIDGTTTLETDGGYTNVAGPYHVRFGVEEDTVKRTIIASVHDGIEGTEDIMHAIDGSVRPSQIKADTVKTLTESKAWDKATGLPVDYTYIVRNEAGEEVDFTTPQPVGSYKVTFTTEHGTVLERTITVIPGEAPKLEVDPTIVDIELNAALPDYFTGVVATDLEDTNNLPYPDGKVISTGKVETNKKGVQVITYTITDMDGNTTTATRSYVVGAANRNDDYAIFANNFTINDVDVAMENLEKQVIEKSNAFGQKVTDGSNATVKVLNLGGYTNVPGTYSATLAIEADETIMVEVTITVIDTTDYSYSISGENITMDIDVLNEMKRAGTLDAHIRKEAKLEVWEHPTDREMDKNDLELDTKALEKNTVTVGEVYSVQAIYEPDMNEIPGKNTDKKPNTDEQAYAEKTIKVDVTGKKVKPSVLPITGENVWETMIVGTALIVLSGLLFFVRSRKKDESSK